MNVSPLDSPAPLAEANAEFPSAARWIPTPRRLHYVAQRPPALPWLFWATAALGLLAMTASSSLVIPAALVLLLTMLTGLRWRAAKSLAEEKNAEVSSAPGRHALADDAVAVTALVPAQRVTRPTGAGTGEPLSGTGESPFDSGEPLFGTGESPFDSEEHPVGRHRLVESTSH
jgi:hypothetical protein